MELLGGFRVAVGSRLVPEVSNEQAKEILGEWESPKPCIRNVSGPTSVPVGA